jgi:hypothetical protein
MYPPGTEGIQRRVLHDVEVVVVRLRPDRLHETPADAVDVLREGWVVDQRKLRARLEDEPPPELGLRAPGGAAGRGRERDRER